MQQESCAKAATVARYAFAAAVRVRVYLQLLFGFERTCSWLQGVYEYLLSS